MGGNVAVATSRRNAARVLAAVLIAVFTVPLSVSGVAVALADIASDIGSNPVGEQWALNGFNVTFAASTLVWGAFSDHVGRSLSFRIGAAIFILGSAASSLAPTYVALDGCRMLAGVGAGAVFSIGSALLSETFESQRRARAFALMGATAGLSLASGPPLCGFLSQEYSWRLVFVVQALVLAVSVALLWKTTASQATEERSQRRFDWPAAALFFLLIGCLVSAIVSGPPGSWTSPGAILLIVACVALLIGLVVREAHASNPILDSTLVRHHRFVGVSLVVAVASFTFATTITYVPGLLQAEYGYSPAASGLTVLLMTVPTLIAPVIAGVCASRGVSVRLLLSLSTVLMLIGTLTLALSIGDSEHLNVLPMIVLGIGFGMHAGLVDNEGLAAAPASASGTAAGWINTMRVGTETIAVSMFGSVFIPSLSRGNPATAFRAVSVIAVIVAAGIGMFSIVEMYRKDHHPTSD